MSEDSWREEIAPMVRTSQIIVGALITGVLVFFTVASVLVVQGTFNGEGPGDDSMLFAMNVNLVVFLCGVMIARMIVPGLIVFQARTIVAAALLEGLAFFATIVFMITQSMIGLTIATVMVFGLMLHFPTRSGVTHWIDEQLALIEQERAIHPE